MQIAVLVDNSQAAAAYIRDYRAASRPSSTRAAERDRRSTRSRSSRWRSGRRSSPIHLRPREALKGVKRIFAQPAAATYLLDGIIETSQGITKREAPRPVIVAITTEGPELSDRQYQEVLEPLRDVGRGAPRHRARAPSNDISDDARTGRCSTRARGGPAAGATSLLASTALPDELKQLAAELKHQYRVTYARPAVADSARAHDGQLGAQPGLTARGTLINEKRDQGRP